MARAKSSTQPDGRSAALDDGTSSGPAAPESRPGSDASAQRVVVPVIAEELSVTKRRVTTGRVRVTKRLKARVQRVDEPLGEEKVYVQRVAVNKPIPKALPVRREGDAVIVPVMEERIVRQLYLKEELRITKRRTERRDPRDVRVAYEEISIERLPEAGAEEADSSRATPADPV